MSARPSPTLSLAALLLAVLLSGCASLRPAPEPADWQAHRTQVAALEHWQLTGRLGLRAPGENNSANLRWQQQAEHFRLDLSGPFGQGRVLLSGDQHLVTLEQSGQPPQYAASAEQLIHTHTGWQLPVADLRYWVRGIPAPDSPVTRLQLSPQGLLEQLEQSGWLLHYSQYSSVDGWPLPGRIVAEHRELRVTLVIRQWDTPDTAYQPYSPQTP